MWLGLRHAAPLAISLDTTLNGQSSRYIPNVLDVLDLAILTSPSSLAQRDANVNIQEIFFKG